jgi:hemerythrin-like domain-containing protein
MLLPVDLLVSEHRTIERMIKPIKKEIARIDATGKVNAEFIDIAVDFIRTYADHCHHGKEEGILFRELAKKKLSEEHATTMKELIQEHVYARTTTRNLEKAKDSYVGGNPEAIKNVCEFLNDLAAFYPKHIEKEDKRFFYPTMEYFTLQEQEAMLKEFLEFDQKLIHEKYAKTADEMERMTSEDS